MIISDGEKNFDKIKHWFMVKIIQKMGIEGIYLNTVKAICDKPTANVILNGEKLKAFPLRSGTRLGLSTFSTIIQNSSESPNTAIREVKEIQVIQIRKEVKLALFADDMILYIEKPKNCIRKLLELISEFSKVAEYKINTQKALAFLKLTVKNQKGKLRNQSHSPLQHKE